MFYPARRVSRGNPQPLTALSTITCCYSHTQELSILSSVFPCSHRSSYPSIYKKTKQICTSALGMCPFGSAVPFVSGCFYPLSVDLPLLTLASVSLFHSTRREGVCVKTKAKVARDTTLNSIFPLFVLNSFDS